MAGWSQTIIVGNVGRDAETRFLQDGTQVTNFSVGVTEGGRGENAETVWYKVTTWKKLAETASSYVKKGMQIMVIGRIHNPNAYLNKAGQPAAQLEMTGFSFQFLGKKEEEPDPLEIAFGSRDKVITDVPF